MKADKKVRITVTVPNGEAEKLRSFPYFTSFIVSCLLEEFFSRADVAEMVKEMNTEGTDVKERLAVLRGYIKKACFPAGGNKHKGSEKMDYWKLIEE